MSQQTSVGNLAPGFAGMRVGMGHKARSKVNDAGMARAQYLITVSSAVDSTAYTFSVGGFSVSYTSGVGATLSSIRDGLLAAGRASADVDALVHLNPIGADSLRITSKEVGLGPAVAESDLNLALATEVAGASTEPLPFGRAVVKGANDDSVKLPDGASQKVLGFVERIHTDVDPDNAGEEVSPGQACSIIHEGPMYVELEAGESPVVGGDVYVRKLTADFGKVRTDAGGGDAEILPGASFESGALAGGICEISLNLP